MEKKSLYIETERLIVRSVRESDAEVLYRVKTDPRVLEYCPDLFDIDAGPEDMPKYIRAFTKLEEEGDPDPWRVYPIENRETGEVMGCLTASLQNMLREYELGWMMLGQFTKQGYASEAAAAYAEYFSKTRGIDYMIAVMDVDNPASRRTAEKAGFRLFEKRTVYDYSYGRYCDDYLYLRRYSSECTLKERFYGDVPYYGRFTSDKPDL